MADVRSRAIVLLATMVVACTIGGLPPQPNQDAATGVGGAGGRSIGANADAANIGPGIEGGTNSGGAGTTGSAGGAPSTGGIPAMGGTGKGGVLGVTGGVAAGGTSTGGSIATGGASSTGGASISGGTTTTGGTTGAGGTSSAGGTTSAGGTKTAGGTTAAGGTSSAGGTTTTGGTTASGGTSSAGGTTAMGGTTASAGKTSAGGTTTAGGTTAGGGTSSAGGTTTTGGTTASAGTSGGTSGATPPSCSGLAATCGPSGNESCCTTLLVPGGTFYRSYDGVTYTDKSYPATVADFYLDKYEITVGRFRQFVNAGMGTQAKPPGSGAGIHPLIAGSGWNSASNTNLMANTAALTTAMKCDSMFSTWTDTALGNESRPQNCIDWYEAFAFCAWDGGRLATEAEWNYAAAGGSEQREYPWSIPATSTTIDDSYAVYCGGTCSAQNVGSKSTKGDGKWGHSDLAGNVWEWTLDWYATYQAPCDNCADLTVAFGRVVRGAGFRNDASYLRSALRNGSFVGNPGYRSYSIGARCARTSL